MQEWINKIGYGDKNISSGIDNFWLPREGKKSILISPEEQARLLKKLINEKLPFSENAQKILREINGNSDFSYVVVGFLDDQAVKIGKSIHGVKVIDKIKIIVRNAKGNKNIKSCIFRLLSFCCP